MPGGPNQRARPTPKRARAHTKTPGGSPAFLLILLSGYLFQRTQVDSLESFQVRFQQWKHF